MSDLSFIEKERLEKMFSMQSGFVLNFEYNSKFKDFVRSSVGVNIYDDKYILDNGSSKAKRLRKFWELESNQLVGKLINDLLDYILEIKINIDKTAFEQCRKIANRLLGIENLEIDLDSEKEFLVLTESIKESINKNTPEAGLDRLHTYTTKIIRKICRKRGIDIQFKNGAKLEYKPLHSLMGEYIKLLENKKEIESETTKRILKSSISIFECFNDTRNSESLAHDNPILNKDESLLILKYIAITLAFIKIIEHRRVENFKIEKDLPDKLILQILVSDVVKKKVILKERNNQFIGLCPFHNEKSPSFTVNDQKGFYHCFGCGAHGDIIKFVMDNEKIDFRNAIIKLIDEFILLIKFTPGLL